MRIAILFFAFFVVSVTCACDLTVAQPDLAAIVSQGHRLTDGTSKFGSIAPNHWPPAIARLRPERVYRTPAGLYIVTDSFFVEERGLFVPEPKTIVVAGPGSDPRYESIGEGVFAYEIRG